MALAGIRVVEFAGLAPGPMCGMILADFGAKVIRVDRLGDDNEYDKLSRGKSSIAVDLKKPEGLDIVRRMINSADVVLEPYRKGVMEKLGLGPKVFEKSNPRLVYARLTGYGQTGNLAGRAGHDINFLAISGMLSRLGRQGEKPHAPINLLADFAGGGLTCALGIMMALYERQRSGKGQVIDSNMVEGVNYLSSFVWRSISSPMWGQDKGTGWLDGGAPFYDTYETKDGRYVAVGAIEPQFYEQLIKGLGLTGEEAPQFGSFEEVRQKFTEIFSSKTQEEWCEVFDYVDACVTPVLTMEEATSYHHNKNKGSFLQGAAVDHAPRAAPILERTPCRHTDLPQPLTGQHTIQVLRELHFHKQDIDSYIKSGAIHQAKGKAKL